MAKAFRPIILCAAACCLIAAARAEEKANDKTAAGRTLALEVCAACHVVAKEQSFQPILQPPAPNFKALVRRPALSETFLRHFLSSPHGSMGEKGGMPNPRLADYQIDEIVTYLMSLKARR